MNQNKLLKRFGLFVTMLLFLAGSVIAQTTIYVDASAGTDNASQGDGPGTDAYRTLAYAYTQIPGNLTTISIAAQDYNEAVTFDDTPATISRLDTVYLVSTQSGAETVAEIRSLTIDDSLTVVIGASGQDFNFETLVLTEAVVQNGAGKVFVDDIAAIGNASAALTSTALSSVENAFTYSDLVDITYTGSINFTAGPEFPADLNGGTLTVNLTAATDTLTISSAFTASILDIDAGYVSANGNITLTNVDGAAANIDIEASAGLLQNGNSLYWDSGDATDGGISTMDNDGSITGGTLQLTGTTAANTYVFGSTTTGVAIVSNLVVPAATPDISVIDELEVDDFAYSSANNMVFVATENLTVSGNFARYDNTIGNIDFTTNDAALIFDGAADQTFDTGLNWIIDDLTINNATDMTVTLSNASSAGLEMEGSLTINTNSLLDISGRNIHLDGAGETFANGGTFASTGGGYIVFRANQSFTGAGSFGNIEVRSGTTTLTSAIAMSGDLLLSGGILDLTTFDLTFTKTFVTTPHIKLTDNSSTVDDTGGGNFAVATETFVDFTLTATGASNITGMLVPTDGMNDVNMIPAAAATVTLDAMVTELVGTLTINEDVTTAGGATVLTLSASSKDHTVAGNCDELDLDVTGDACTLTGITDDDGDASLGDLDLSLAADETFTSTLMQIFDNVTVDNGTSVITMDGDDADITTLLTVTDGKLTLGMGDAAADQEIGAVTVTDGELENSTALVIEGLLNFDDGLITLGGNLTLEGAVDRETGGTFAGTDTVIVETNGAFNIGAALTIPNLVMSSAGTATLGEADLTVSSYFNITTGVFANGGNNLVLSAATVDFTGGSITGAGYTQFTNAAATGTMYGNVALTNVEFNSSGTITLTSDDTTTPTVRTITVDDGDIDHTAGDITLTEANLIVSGTTTYDWTAGDFDGHLTMLGDATGQLNLGTAAAFNVSKLEIAAAATPDDVPTGATIEGVDELVLTAGAFTDTNTPLELNDGATITVVAGTLVNTPTWGSSVNLVYTLGGAYDGGNEIPATDIINDFSVAGALLDIEGVSFTVNGTLAVASTGSIELDVAADDGSASGIITLAADAILSLGLDPDAAFLDNGAAAVAADLVLPAAGYSLILDATAAGFSTTDVILPTTAVINDLTISGTAANDITYHLSAAADDLTITGDFALTGLAGFIIDDVDMTFNGGFTQASTGTIANTNTAPATIEALVLGGTSRDFTISGTFTVPDDMNFEINLASDTSIVTLTGGDLDISAGTANSTDYVFVLTEGVLATSGTAAVILRQDVTAAGDIVPIQGFTRTNGVIVGKVTKKVDVSATVAISRIEYPTGTVDGEYRSATFFFNTAPTVDFNLSVDHNAVSPTGTDGFPLDLNAEGDALITNYAPFHWVISTDRDLSQGYEYELELGAEGYTAFVNDGVEDIRIIRRVDGLSSNNWRLQGDVNTDYDNYAKAADYPVIKVGNATGGLLQDGSLFSYSQMNKAPTITIDSSQVNAVDSVVTAGAITIAEMDTLAVWYSTEDADFGQTPTFAYVSGPDGVEFVDSTKTFTWMTTYADSGSHKIIVSSSDDDATTYDTLTVTVNNVNQAPVFTTYAADSLLFAGDAYTFTYVATDADGDALTYALLSAPDSMTIVDSTGVVAWDVLEADEDSVYTVSVEATDFFGLKDTTTAILSVNMNVAPVFTQAIYSDSAFVGDSEWAQDSVSITVVATDLNMATAGDVLVFGFADPETTADIEKMDDTTAVVTWLPGDNRVNVFFDITVTDGELSDTAQVQFIVKDITSVTDEIPAEFVLDYAYPNPFNPTTTIKYGLKTEAQVTVQVFNVLGQVVETMVNSVQQAGYHTQVFNASQLASGMYIFRIQAVAVDGSETFVDVKKMMLMK